MGNAYGICRAFVEHCSRVHIRKPTEMYELVVGRELQRLKRMVEEAEAQESPPPDKPVVKS